MSAHFVDRNDVIGILFRFQVENERRKSDYAQCRGGKDRTFKARPGAIAQNFSRRTRGGPKMYGSASRKR